MTDRLMIEPPTIEQLFRRLIDGMGYHDADSIPVKDVFIMFEAFFNYEHKYNTHLQELLNEYSALILKPIVKLNNTGDL